MLCGSLNLKRERSIRFRLTVWYALILVAALGLFSGLIWFSLRQRLLSEVDRDLSDRAAPFEHYVTREAAEVAPESDANAWAAVQDRERDVPVANQRVSRGHRSHARPARMATSQLGAVGS